MTCPQIVKDLVNKFSHNYSQYKSSDYNETSVRREFIDPFFKSLGWDIDNEAGLDEEFKDVIHEDALRVGESSRAPDYSFRIGGRRIFFVEAKKPYVNLKESAEPAFQVRRYGYSAQLKVSILTDFEEFSVYDVTVKPSLSEKASTRRLLYFTFDQYEEKWDEIAALFSKDAIQHGSIRRYTENLTSGKKQQGTQGLDKDFLTEIEGWREILARNIALRNKDLTQPELNLAVQMTIDRILFIRICEDRGIEPFGQLGKAVENINHYQSLISLFKNADAKYNSGLFHFSDEDGKGTHDTLTLSIIIDDAPIKEIIKHLYWPTPYVFSEIPAVILGQVYEQFLGKVIRLTPDHHAKVEDKPEVKKAGGVFYTPTYIVDYIVEKTVGSLVEGKSPREVSELHILDPACGSGSFLIGAYQYLLDWHKRWYSENLAPLLLEGKKSADREVQDLIPIVNVSTGKGRGKKSGNEHSLPIYKMTDTDWHLTTSEKKRILLNNIYGVDIDTQAVEVTKLSLLLKVLEGESGERIGQKKLVTGRVLPSLDQNIRCGNSLIAGDILSDASLDIDTVRTINPFDWDREFSSIMQTGGFDVVIGNPPYVRQELLKGLKEYFSSHYQTYQGTADLYIYFIEKGVSLLRDGGQFSYIVANKWMRAAYGKPLRSWLKEQQIDEIIDFGDLPVFTQATTYPCIIRVSKVEHDDEIQITNVETLDFPSLGQYVLQNNFSLEQKKLDNSGWALVDGNQKALLDKIRSAGIPLGEYVGGKIYYGIKTGLNKAFVITEETKNRLIAEDKNSEEVIKPFLAGRELKRYQIPSFQNYIIYIPWHFPLNDESIQGASKNAEICFKERYPAIYTHLLKFKDELKARNVAETGIRYEWYALQRFGSLYASEFLKPKILIPAIVKNASYAYDPKGIFYSNDKTSIIPTEDLFLLGLLNSKISDYYLHSIASTKQGGYFEYKPMYVSQIPILLVDSTNAGMKTSHDQIVIYVTRMLDLYKQLGIARLPQDKDIIQRQIDATDKAINALVYDLYGLTKEEIRIVEEALI